jgi:hypothetical protein
MIEYQGLTSFHHKHGIFLKTSRYIIMKVWKGERG